MSTEQDTTYPPSSSHGTWATTLSASDSGIDLARAQRIPLVATGTLALLRSQATDDEGVRELFDADTVERAAQRFLVRFEWETNEGDYGAGEALEVPGAEGPVWLYIDRSEDLVIKVAPDYESNDLESNRYWIYARRRIDLDIRMQVLDRWTGAGWRYGNG